MSQHDEDRDKVVNALGGKKGLIDSGLPSVVFLIVFNFTGDLNWAMWSAVSLSLLLAIIRLMMKDTIQHALSGVIGVAICVIFASRSGNATDFYIPKLLTNLGYGAVYLIANLVGWPILGLVLGPLLGENFTWRNHPARKKMYIKASWIWVGMFFSRIAVQYPIYKSGNVNLLGTVNLAMGYPLFFAAAYGTWRVIKAGPPAVKVAD
jgi:xanthine/uracil permease